MLPQAGVFIFEPDPEKMRAAWEGRGIPLETVQLRGMVEEAYGKKLDKFELIITRSVVKQGDRYMRWIRKTIRGL